MFVSSFVVHWWVQFPSSFPNFSHFIARLVERKCYLGNRKTRSYHCSRQLLFQGHGSGKLSSIPKVRPGDVPHKDQGDQEKATCGAKALTLLFCTHRRKKNPYVCLLRLQVLWLQKRESVQLSLQNWFCCWGAASCFCSSETKVVTAKYTFVAANYPCLLLPLNVHFTASTFRSCTSRNIAAPILHL